MDATAIQISRVEIRIRPYAHQPDFLGFADFTLDDALHVRDVRIFRGPSGRLEVVYPARPMRTTCRWCGGSTDAGGRYCCQCGASLGPGGGGKGRRFVKPANCKAARLIETAILEAYCEATAGAAPAARASA